MMAAQRVTQAQIDEARKRGFRLATWATVDDYNYAMKHQIDINKSAAEQNWGADNGPLAAIPNPFEPTATPFDAQTEEERLRLARHGYTPIGGLAGPGKPLIAPGATLAAPVMPTLTPEELRLLNHYGAAPKIPARANPISDDLGAQIETIRALNAERGIAIGGPAVREATIGVPQPIWPLAGNRASVGPLWLGPPAPSAPVADNRVPQVTMRPFGGLKYGDAPARQGVSGVEIQVGGQWIPANQTNYNKWRAESAAAIVSPAVDEKGSVTPRGAQSYLTSGSWGVGKVAPIHMGYATEEMSQALRTYAQTGDRAALPMKIHESGMELMDKWLGIRGEGVTMEELGYEKGPGGFWFKVPVLPPVGGSSFASQRTRYYGGGYNGGGYSQVEREYGVTWRIGIT